MDRPYKAFDRVHVYQNSVDEARLDVFEAQPFSRAGFEYYMYKGVMYPAFTYRTNNQAQFILLNEPMKFS